MRAIIAFQSSPSGRGTISAWRRNATNSARLRWGMGHSLCWWCEKADVPHSTGMRSVSLAEQRRFEKGANRLNRQRNCRYTGDVFWKLTYDNYDQSTLGNTRPAQG